MFDKLPVSNNVAKSYILTAFRLLLLFCFAPFFL